MPAQSVHAFAEKVALVTDGTNPVGRAVAMQLALLGSYVIVGLPADSKEDENALNELKSLGTLANAVKADISTVEGAKNLVAEVEKMFGRLDLLVNCLKLETDSIFDETNEKDFDDFSQCKFEIRFFRHAGSIEIDETAPETENRQSRFGD